jgi:bifunctional non-homologous end joining protein LigD
MPRRPPSTDRGARRAKPRLSEYARKRHFDVTSEPAPEAPARRAREGALFMVHKHDASRLHYDLRFEIDGALASWACPKGPSYDPKDKRLAVEVEDHPLAYGDFEGRIPDGEYGAGDSIIWDRGTYDTEPPGQVRAQRQKGHLHLVLHGEKLNGGWHLVRTRGNGGKPQWLCFKAKDGTERPGYDVLAERPESVKSGRRATRGPTRMKSIHGIHLPPEKLLEKVWPPMLALLDEERPAPESEYVYEVKYDGFRALASLSGGKLAVRSRNALDFVARFPFLHKALTQLVVGEAVLDGEIVAVDDAGRSSFQRIGDAGSAQQFVAFDLLWLEGEDLRGKPLEERRELLESLLAGARPPLVLAERVPGPQSEAMARARSESWEGLIAKKKGSTYLGARTVAWLKLKVKKTAELAIVGWTPHSAISNQVGALLLASRGKKGLVFAGKVGTGFNAKMRAQLFKQLNAVGEGERVEGAPRYRDAHWAAPKLVAQIGFSEWTRDGKLRHPSFQGLREDKPISEVDAAPGSGAVSAERRIEAPAFGVWHSKDRAEVRGPRAEVLEVPLTHGDRVLFPKSGLTKADVRAYYDAVAAVMVPAMIGRPISMQQWPQGIAGESFFRHDARGAPEWVTRAKVEHESRSIDHIVVDRPETLSWLANQSALTLHIPASRVGSLENPDWVVFDFDPATDDWEQVAPLARALHGLLEELKLPNVPKTSGKRGLHVLVPLAAGHTQEQVHHFAASVAQVLVKKFSQLATNIRAKSGRKGRLYLDVEQNGFMKTIVAPYSIRAVEGAPVSAPLEWDEVKKGFDPSKLTIKTMIARLKQRGDLFAPALAGQGRLADIKE